MPDKSYLEGAIARSDARAARQTLKSANGLNKIIANNGNLITKRVWTFLVTVGVFCAFMSALAGYYWETVLACFAVVLLFFGNKFRLLRREDRNKLGDLKNLRSKKL